MRSLYSDSEKPRAMEDDNMPFQAGGCYYADGGECIRLVYVWCAPNVPIIMYPYIL